MSIKQIVIEAAKDAPVVSLGAAKLWGIPLDWYVWTFGALYIVGRAMWFGVECYWKWEDRKRASQ